MLIEFNTEEFLKSVDEITNNIKATLTVNMEKTADLLLGQARNNSLARYDTGQMEKDSGTQVNYTSDFVEGWVGFFEFYSVYQHQGTGIHALNQDGRQTPWWWRGTTEKWEGWHRTRGVEPCQFLYKAFINCQNDVPILLSEGLR